MKKLGKTFVKKHRPAFCGAIFFYMFEKFLKNSIFLFTLTLIDTAKNICYNILTTTKEETTMQTFKFRNATYEGQAIDGVPNGKGRLTWDNGVFYDGDFANGQFHGNGSYFVSDYALYEGEWVNGTFTGKGKITYLNGEIYEGEFLNGKLIK